MSTTNVQTVANQGDRLKITLAIVAIVAGIFGYSYFAEMNIFARIAIFVGGLALAAILVWFTDWGKRSIDFARGAYNEMKRVVWPTRKEVIQMTGIVFLFVFIMSLFLWIADTLIDWILYGVFLGWN